MAGLKTFIAISLYMGMKNQSNLESYWSKPNSISYYSIILKFMTHERFEALYITNFAQYDDVERGMPGFDKIRQVH
jgi:hypothetical protein